MATKNIYNDDFDCSFLQKYMYINKASKFRFYIYNAVILLGGITFVWIAFILYDKLSLAENKSQMIYENAFVILAYKIGGKILVKRSCIVIGCIMISMASYSLIKKWIINKYKRE